MFFLIVCGFAVEAAIGPWIFLSLYFISALGGDLLDLYALADMSSTTPSVGASGAVSGVMAMYLALFRLRKIQFFYWVFIFVGYFRAPALVILPFYVGEELWNNYTRSGSSVAFLAHVGGFLSGSVFLGILYAIKPDIINHEYVEQDQTADPEREDLAKIYALIEKMRFAKALKAIELHQKTFGPDLDLSVLSVRLASELDLASAKARFLQLVSFRPANERELLNLVSVWTKEEEFRSALSRKQLTSLALTFATVDHVSLSEEIFKSLYDPEQPDSSLDVLARKLSLTYEKVKDKNKHALYGSIADKLIKEGM
jgi:hypothetical protein